MVVVVVAVMDFFTLESWWLAPEAGLRWSRPATSRPQDFNILRVAVSMSQDLASIQIQDVQDLFCSLYCA